MRETRAPSFRDAPCWAQTRNPAPRTDLDSGFARRRAPRNDGAVRRVGKGALRAVPTIATFMVGTPSAAHARDRWLCPPYGRGAYGGQRRRTRTRPLALPTGR